MLDFLMHLGLLAIGLYVGFWAIILGASMCLGILAMLVAGLTWVVRRMAGRVA